MENELFLCCIVPDGKASIKVKILIELKVLKPTTTEHPQREHSLPEALTVHNFAWFYNLLDDGTGDWR